MLGEVAINGKSKMFPSQNIDKLKQDLVEDKSIALFLGSGTDLTKKYPPGACYARWRDPKEYKISWDNLVKALVEAAGLSEDEKKAINRISNNPLKVAILKNRMGDSYIPIIQGWLYERCNQGVLWDSYKVFREYKEQPSVEKLQDVPFGTLFFIADLILRQATIKAVFTQNYNNFLSEAIRILLEEARETYPMERRSLNPIDAYAGWKDGPNDKNSFFIYHVHGYIPPTSEIAPRKESNEIVLSDEEFYRLSKDVFSWQNASQIHFLTHHTCILLGLSLDDLTILRLLRHANIENNSETVYWIRGGALDGNEAESQLKAEYFESQMLCVVNDENGYADLYHQLLEVLRNKESQTL